MIDLLIETNSLDSLSNEYISVNLVLPQGPKSPWLNIDGGGMEDSSCLLSKIDGSQIESYVR